jgi:predicted cupin superfamily sugar epimerase
VDPPIAERDALFAPPRVRDDGPDHVEMRAGHPRTVPASTPMRTVGARLSSLVNAQDVVALLGLAPHPEGGWFRETWRSEAGTAIYYLLEEHQRSHWHRINADEVWHFYAGDPLALSVSADGVGEERFVLGPDLGAGHRPQHVVAAGAWQAAHPLGRWTLVGCTVSPAFDFAGFELAPPGWAPR